MSETEQALKRLLRRVGREATKREHVRAHATSFLDEERARSEVTMLRMTQGFIRDELRKVKKP